MNTITAIFVAALCLNGALASPVSEVQQESRSIYSTSSGMYLGLNATSLTLVMVVVLGAAFALSALGGVFYYLSTTDALPLKSKQGQNYYDPNADLASDAALEYAAATVQNTNTSQDYRRKRSTYEQSKS